MADRAALVEQMAKAFRGQKPAEPSDPDERTRNAAEEALERVEVYLGLDVEQAKDILERVLEDVT